MWYGGVRLHPSKEGLHVSWLLWPAKIGRTLLYGQVEVSDEQTHFGGHECVVTESLRSNALLLPVPTAALGTLRKRTVASGPCVLRDMAKTHRPGTHELPPTPQKPEFALTRTLIVRDAQPETFATALEMGSLPHELRPEINEDLLAQLAKEYPNWPLIVRLVAPTSFAESAIPLPRLFYSYEPADPGRLFLPTAEPRYDPSLEDPQPMRDLTDVLALLGHQGGRPHYLLQPATAQFILAAWHDVALPEPAPASGRAHGRPGFR